MFELGSQYFSASDLRPQTLIWKVIKITKCFITFAHEGKEIKVRRLSDEKFEGSLFPCGEYALPFGDYPDSPIIRSYWKIESNNNVIV